MVHQSWVRVLSKYSSTSTEYFRSTRVRVRVLYPFLQKYSSTSTEYSKCTHEYFNECFWLLIYIVKLCKSRAPFATHETVITQYSWQSIQYINYVITYICIYKHIFISINKEEKQVRHHNISTTIYMLQMNVSKPQTHKWSWNVKYCEWQLHFRKFTSQKCGNSWALSGRRIFPKIFFFWFFFFFF